MSQWKPPAPVQKTDQATVVVAPSLDEMTDPALADATTTVPLETAPTWKQTMEKYRDSKNRMATSHTHNYTGIVSEAIPFQRAILFRVCACGNRQAFEMGDREAMRTLYLQLKEHI